MFKHILIPTDGSELSQKAIRTGVELARFHGARVTGVHAIPDYHLMIAYEGAFDPVTEERIEKEARSRADGYLEFIQKACGDTIGLACDQTKSFSVLLARVTRWPPRTLEYWLASGHAMWAVIT